MGSREPHKLFVPVIPVVVLVRVRWPTYSRHTHTDVERMTRTAKLTFFGTAGRVPPCARRRLSQQVHRRLPKHGRHAPEANDPRQRSSDLPSSSSLARNLCARRPPSSPTILSNAYSSLDILCASRGYMLRPPLTIARYKRLFHPNSRSSVSTRFPTGFTASGLLLTLPPQR